MNNVSNNPIEGVAFCVGAASPRWSWSGQDLRVSKWESMEDDGSLYTYTHTYIYIYISSHVRSFSSCQTLPMPGCISRSVPASSHMYSSLTCLVPACHLGGRPTWVTLSTWFLFISLPCLPCFAYLRPSYNPSIRLPAKGAYWQSLFHILPCTSCLTCVATSLDIFTATRQLAFMQMQDHLHHCWRRSLQTCKWWDCGQGFTTHVAFWYCTFLGKKTTIL